eukprot:TRINITY_DN3466_c0_g1_i1.p1 TRINITY_DN3466_c0_g1~~TRINITY_DN3466_c0_g1_i1.p1  ORF type:complete len:517 (-),score=23.81 TRINITY_DN3466_c0_g1_i1:47-1567(-)
MFGHHPSPQWDESPQDQKVGCSSPPPTRTTMEGVSGIFVPPSEIPQRQLFMAPASVPSSLDVLDSNPPLPRATPPVPTAVDTFPKPLPHSSQYTVLAREPQRDVFDPASPSAETLMVPRSDTPDKKRSHILHTASPRTPRHSASVVGPKSPTSSRRHSSRLSSSEPRYVLGKPWRIVCAKPSPAFLSRTAREFEQRDRKNRQAPDAPLISPRGMGDTPRNKRPDPPFRSSVVRLEKSCPQEISGTPGPGTYHSDRPSPARPRTATSHVFKSVSPKIANLNDKTGSGPSEPHLVAPPKASSFMFMSNTPRLAPSCPQELAHAPGPGTYGAPTANDARRSPTENFERRNSKAPFGRSSPRPCLASKERDTGPGPGDYDAATAATAAKAKRNSAPLQPDPVFRSKSPRLALSCNAEATATPGPGAYGEQPEHRSQGIPKPDPVFRSKSPRLVAEPKPNDHPGPGAYQWIAPQGGSFHRHIPPFNSTTARDCLQKPRAAEVPGVGAYELP